MGIAVRLSGLTKQDYTIRLQCLDVVVHGNPRVYKALCNQLADVLVELQRIAPGSAADSELLSTIQLIAVTMSGLKEDSDVLYDESDRSFIVCCNNSSRKPID